ncbi:Homeodomain-like domain-containing protein [Carboxydocella sporoproducens DSM 16521]|uniref:Homeodomain-like domain-containing protein n=2 Tax=Carboxydocella TaxID=178898 RepID=A0A1T4Q4F3_9FIRM|nr:MULTISPECIES: helix-turn-helix domain-containing protein [Carboxydocella]AVX21156.1 Homeodomain-like domain-containing protein [Carboxydocella thermautotrophica]AVX31591.1 Homeodomain-like domain-containing protein [Carboxydocella thermautotrophica]SJZ98643.1 Homeodomain-like domain-containing protein [Carboxydocella sporoproducens DSM 16521]
MRGAPWDTQPALKEMCAETGVNLDRLLAGIKRGRSDEEIASEMGVPPTTITRLRRHFEKYGIASVEGQD